MEKIFILFLAAVLLFSFVSCSKEAADLPVDEQLVGIWKYSYFTDIKDMLTDVIPEEAFYDVYYQYNADGTGKSWMDEDEDKPMLEFTYDFNGTDITLYFDDGTTDTVQCKIEGNSMTIAFNEEEDMIFIKQ